MNQSWENVFINPNDTIRHALEVINSEALQVALVVDDSRRLLGVVTDGDIRRGLLQMLPLDSTVSEIMNPNPVTMGEGVAKAKLVGLMKEKVISSVPIVKEGIVVGLVTLRDAIDRPYYDNPVFLMAGGFGTRLRPLTDDIPKPLLKVGGKPILERILCQFVDAGFYNIFISTHYKAKMVRDYFGDGKQWGVNIKYVHEDTPLGTAGALGLLPKDFATMPIMMMNGDLLTTVNFNNLLDYHVKHGGEATMCVREYDFQVPYGVVTGKDNRVYSIVEKPIHKFFVNAGIYVLDPLLLENVIRGSYLDMPQFLESRIDDGGRVNMFPVHEYWLDIGRKEEFERASVEIFGL
jgi:dTDP-glucose pyrophosphorylase/predicted transcriptional regulator